MSTTSTATKRAPRVTPVTHAELARVRAMISDALLKLATSPDIPAADSMLAEAMADNVLGWTHTTRLRDFLDKVER